jgi:hypothetical protein
MTSRYFQVLRETTLAAAGSNSDNDPVRNHGHHIHPRSGVALVSLLLVGGSAPVRLADFSKAYI